MGMQEYMGYKVPLQTEQPERTLPSFDIAGTLFVVDVVKREFREMADPKNRMPLGNVKEEYGFSTIFYDRQTKNLYPQPENINDVPGHVRLVMLPPLKELDPVGLARLHG